MWVKQQVCKVWAIAALAVVSVATPAWAEERFSNGGIQFDVDTVIEFEFLESNGAYQSTFGVVNLNTGERTPLIREMKPSDRYQSVEQPSDFMDDTGLEDQNDFPGTPGNAVPQPLAEFEFRANTPYAFYLESIYNGQPAGIFYSTDGQNPGVNSRVRFDGGIAGLAANGVMVRWDDTGSLLVDSQAEDQDYDDFVLRAGGHLVCP
jgi:hypothetical protein